MEYRDMSFDDPRAVEAQIERGIRQVLGPQVVFHHTAILTGRTGGKPVAHAGDSQIGLHETGREAVEATNSTSGPGWIDGKKVRIGELARGEQYYVHGYTDTVNGNRGDKKDRGLFIHGETDGTKHP